MTVPSVKLKQVRNGHRTTAKKTIKVADDLIPGYDPDEGAIAEEIDESAELKSRIQE